MVVCAYVIYKRKSACLLLCWFEPCGFALKRNLGELREDGVYKI